MSSRTFTRRLEQLEAELAPPKDSQMIEICICALVTGEILHRFFMPRDPPKRGDTRPWSPNTGQYASSGSWVQTNEPDTQNDSQP
jgi:hypothetical protein